MDARSRKDKGKGFAILGTATNWNGTRNTGVWSQASRHAVIMMMMMTKTMMINVRARAVHRMLIMIYGTA
jgi:hypothetical protein